MNELILWTILSIENEDDRIFAEELYGSHYALIKNTILKILKTNTEDINDLIHDVFVKLIAKISLLRSLDEMALISYIAVVSKNTAINYIKRREMKSGWTFHGEEDIIDSITDDNKMPDELFIIKEETENLYEILKQLPEKYKLILQFKYFFKMNDKDIAPLFDIAPGSVKVYISRAKKMAYKLLKESEIDVNEPKQTGTKQN
jgi:RNA polymerase sigma-70 factor (ECF subfamily)